MTDWNDNKWGPRTIFLLALINQTSGITIFLNISSYAVKGGVIGQLLVTIAGYIVLGIPLLYMELAVSQFTARDCIDVWKARSCLSHIGYVQLLCQFILVNHSHMITTFVTYYLIVTFENPIPYHTCGPWSNENCNMITYNYTVNRDCLNRNGPKFCDDLHLSFPEHQFWRHFTRGLQRKPKNVTGRVILASGLLCGILFLCCFKGKKSVIWSLKFTALYPILGYFILLIVSMLQNGVIANYEAAFDVDFSTFSTKFRVSELFMEVLIALNIGTGIGFNISASSSFRSPCYSNVIILIAICICITLLTVLTTVMTACPYLNEYGFNPAVVFQYPMMLIFEKIPMFMKFYTNRKLCLSLIFSSNIVNSLSTNVIMIINFQDLIVKRFERANNYFGFITLFIVTLIFLLSVPGLLFMSIQISHTLRRVVALISVLLGAFEFFVFVLWYGSNKFSEDIHFMQGFQSKDCIKFSHFSACVLLCCMLCFELLTNQTATIGYADNPLALMIFFVIGPGIILVILMRLLIAAFKKRFHEEVRLDITWGPRSDVLLRSRAMFTARAMTKEYLYRQYHIQARIFERQNRANVRNQILHENI